MGRLLRLAAVDYDERAIRESLPRRFMEENLAAIRFGYELTDEEIARMASEAPPSRFEMNAAASAPAPVRGLDAAYETPVASTSGSESG